MTTHTEVDPFAEQGCPALSFKDAPIGTSYTGRVTESATLVQSRDFETNQPAFWPDGNPKMSAVFRAEFEGLGERSVWAPKPSALFGAIKDAQERAGAKIAPGGTITITYTGDGVRKDGNTRLNPPKQYAATYAPGDAFSDPAPAQPVQVQQPVQQVQQPAYPAVPTQAQPNPLAGLTQDQIAALLAQAQQGQDKPPF